MMLTDALERHLKAAQLLGPRGLAKCHAFVENSKRAFLTLLDARPATLQTQDAIAAYGEISAPV
jgi:hypothetical protein